jgi:hypothetical protein
MQSLDEQTIAYYISLQFKIYSENIDQPKMLHPLEEILLTVKNSKLPYGL